MIVPDPDTSAGERSKILDFGIAKLVRTEGAAGLATSPELVLGTPLYMSPEQCRGSAGVDDRTDVYSFGVMLYWMLTGQPPFSGSLGDVVAKHLFADLPPLAALCKGAPMPLVELMSDLMAKQSQQRPSMSKVTSLLGEIESQLGASETPGTGSELASGSPLPAPGSSGTGQSVEISRSTHGSVSFPAATPQAFALGNKLARPRAGGRTILLVCIGSLILGALGVASQRRSKQAPAVVITAEKNQSPGVAGAVPPAPAPPALARVVISSTPSGALVLRATDRKPLGQTPWQLTKQLEGGTDELLISLPGYAEQRLRLPLDSDFTAHVALVALRPEATTTRPQKVRSSARPYPLQKKRVTGDDDRKSKIELEE